MADLNLQEGFSFEADIFGQRYSAATTLESKMVGPFEVTGFAFTPANEGKFRKSLRLGYAGKNRGSIYQTLATKIKLGFNGTNADINAMTFLGDTSTLAEGSGTVTGESIANMEHDKPYKVSKSNISSLAVTGKTLGTDFEIVDAKLGIVRILSGGTIANDSTVSFNFSYSAVAGKRVRVGNQQKLEYKLIGNLRNRESQTYSRFVIPRVTFSPNEISLIADDYATAELTGECVLMDGETADFYLDNGLTYS